MTDSEIPETQIIEISDIPSFGTPFVPVFCSPFFWSSPAPPICRCVTCIWEELSLQASIADKKWQMSERQLCGYDVILEKTWKYTKQWQCQGLRQKKISVGWLKKYIKMLNSASNALKLHLNLFNFPNQKTNFPKKLMGGISPMTNVKFMTRVNPPPPPHCMKHWHDWVWDVHGF
jgi:hypothetical protein